MSHTSADDHICYQILWGLEDSTQAHIGLLISDAATPCSFTCLAKLVHKF